MPWGPVGFLKKIDCVQHPPTHPPTGCPPSQRQPYGAADVTMHSPFDTLEV